MLTAAIAGMPQIMAWLTMWKIGPECAAQQPKNVSASTMNWGERNACATDRPAPGSAALVDPGAPELAVSGGCLTNSAAGISSVQATMPIVIMAVRQS